MSIIKRILLVIVVIITILLVVALFLKNDYLVERQIVINQPSTKVYNYIKYLKNQDHFSIWNQLDPNMKKSYKGTDGTVGFIAAWESTSDSVGVGEQEIMKLEEGKRVDTQLRFKTPFESKNNAYLITDDLGNNQTRVKWGFTGTMPYPMNLMNLFFNMDEVVGGDFETGLKNLKIVLEKTEN